MKESGSDAGYGRLISVHSWLPEVAFRRRSALSFQHETDGLFPVEELAHLERFWTDQLSCAICGEPLPTPNLSQVTPNVNRAGVGLDSPWPYCDNRVN